VPARHAPAHAATALAAAGGSYLLIGVVLWWHAWSAGGSTHTLCACGDPALFLWFFQWPATAVAHLHNPLYSTALFHPQGVNLLAQTSVLGITVPLIPVTWIFGPVAALNVASTLTPALSAFAAFVVLRRWVHWAPAAYLGGLFFGFSPFVLSSLEFAHFMTAAVMLLPLILAILDDICFRRRHDPRWAGLLLGVLLFWQFFLSSELLLIVLVLIAISLVGLVGYALVFDREGLHLALRPALTGLAVGAVSGIVLLAYPVWFALEGPAHLSGLIWPHVSAEGGFIGSSFVAPDIVHGSRTFLPLSGYEGPQLPSAGYLGWGLLAVVVAGSLIWFRDRRLWFLGFLLGVCVGCSIGERPGQWEPSHMFAHLPVLSDVIEQRFMLIGFLAAAAMLAIICDHVRDAVPVVGVGDALGLAVAAAALVPVAATFAPVLPFTMEAVALPRWYATVAPTLPPGRVLLSYPAPFSGIQVSMAWQAIDAMSYSQAGGGGPEGVPSRAGAAREGFEVLAHLAFSVNTPQPSGTPAQLAAVRQALAVWQVNTVVIAPQPGSSFLLQGRDPTYAAAFMTAVLGRAPHISAGAWVWDGSPDSRLSQAPALTVPPGRIDACVRLAPSHATLRVARCMLAGAS
jgi:dolichyl-phosphate beta-glucosyltransferase